MEHVFTELDPLAKCISSDYVSSISALSGVDTIFVYVEGWEDVAFWTNIFNSTRLQKVKFNIMPPVRDDLAKGKKVVLSFAGSAGKNLLLAVDSDFDWIFGDSTSSGRVMNTCPWLVQTYTYAIENLQCEPSSLETILVKSTKSNAVSFDFVEFFRKYSEAIYPLFLRYAYAAYIQNSRIFPLKRFSNAIRIRRVKLSDSGSSEILRISKIVNRVVVSFDSEYPEYKSSLSDFSRFLQNKGIVPSNTIYFIQGHALKDYAVIPIMEILSQAAIKANLTNIQSSHVSDSIKDNQLLYYKNAVVSFEYFISDNIGYQSTLYYKMITDNINKIISNR